MVFPAFSADSRPGNGSQSKVQPQDLDILDALPILAYRRLAEMESGTPEIMQAFKILLKRSPLLLCDQEFAMLCRRAFLPKKRSRSYRQNEMINSARKKLKAMEQVYLGKDKELRKAHLVFYSRHKMHKVLARHFEEAAPYFEKLGRNQRTSATCVINLRSFSRAIKEYTASVKNFAENSTIEDIYKELIKRQLLIHPQDGSSPLSCPLSKLPYTIIRKGADIGVNCDTHGTSVGLLHALASPFSFAEDRRWHQQNAVVFARTLWARRLNRAVCLENIKILFWGIKRHKKEHGTFPVGNVLDMVETLIEKDFYPNSMMPLCPMNGRPYVIKLPGTENTHSQIRIGCTNHGWMPSGAASSSSK